MQGKGRLKAFADVVVDLCPSLGWGSLDKRNSKGQIDLHKIVQHTFLTRSERDGQCIEWVQHKPSCKTRLAARA